MPKHNLDAVAEKDNLSAKKLHIDVELSTPEPMQNTLMDCMLSKDPTCGKVNSPGATTSTSSTIGSAELEIKTEDDNSAIDLESKPPNIISSATTSIVRPEEMEQIDRPKTVLDWLPNELLRDIYLRLEAPYMLAFKLVSKAAYSITLDRDGKELADLIWEARDDGLSDEFIAMMVDIEAEVPSTIPLERLTCSWNPHAALPRAPEGTKREDSETGWTQNGFADEHFDRTRWNRACLACLDDKPDDEDFHIHGVCYKRCGQLNCEWATLHEGPMERPSPQVLRKFFGDPDELHSSSISVHPDNYFFPSELCSACFFKETREDAMKYLNISME